MIKDKKRFIKNMLIFTLRIFCVFFFIYKLNMGMEGEYLKNPSKYLNKDFLKVNIIVDITTHKKSLEFNRLIYIMPLIMIFFVDTFYFIYELSEGLGNVIKTKSSSLKKFLINKNELFLKRTYRDYLVILFGTIVSLIILKFNIIKSLDYIISLLNILIVYLGVQLIIVNLINRFDFALSMMVILSVAISEFFILPIYVNILIIIITLIISYYILKVVEDKY